MCQKITEIKVIKKKGGFEQDGLRQISALKKKEEDWKISYGERNWHFKKGWWWGAGDRDTGGVVEKIEVQRDRLGD